jgi:neopullulanase
MKFTMTKALLKKNWRSLAAIFLLGSLLPSYAQEIKRIDPPNWFSGMKNESLQLLVYGKDLNAITAIECDDNSIQATLIRDGVLESKNYTIVNLTIPAARKPGTINLKFSGNGKTINRPYELQARKFADKTPDPLTPQDFIYLLMPDRFANANTGNDKISGMNETCFNRDSILCRHGGDLEGVEKHLDYIQSLGVSAIWLNPVQENDQPDESYHGYAVTDHYRIDRRLGTNEDYKRLVQKIHGKGMKVIMDMVFNHIGDRHYLWIDPPSKDWFHIFPSFTRTNYRAPAIMDPYASAYDKTIMQNAWFDKHMPDLNQKNPHLANFLIQNSIWWIEYAGLDAFRVDTWAYPDQEFMFRWRQAIDREFPGFSIFGEVWDHGAAIQAYFIEGSGLNKTSRVSLPAITDFQFYYAINDIAQGKFGWTEGFAKMYYTLAQDFLYPKPEQNIIFLDNHDLSRFYSMCGEDIRRFKTGITLLLTLRGIPCMLYGTEILMKNWANPDARVRNDFPGGWPGDKQNKFLATGRSPAENDAFNFIANLADLRKKNPVLSTGRLTQFVPDDGTYVYFRTNREKVFMIMHNSNDKPKQLDGSRFAEMFKGYQSGTDLLSGKTFDNLKQLNLDAVSSYVVELKR